MFSYAYGAYRRDSPRCLRLREVAVKALKLRIVYAYLSIASMLALVIVGGAGSHWN
jgi:hypothetical protein